MQGACRRCRAARRLPGRGAGAEPRSAGAATRCQGVRRAAARRAWRRRPGGPARESNTSRGSARSGTAAIRKPGASRAGKSFIECTATSIRSSASACSSSLMKSPLPPTSASAAVAIRSPLVRIGTISMLTDGTSAASLFRTNSVCASARRLGREPIRSTEAICIYAAGGRSGRGFRIPRRRRSRGPSRSRDWRLRHSWRVRRLPVRRRADGAQSRRYREGRAIRRRCYAGPPGCDGAAC